MPRLLTFVTCFFWMSAFVLMALAASGQVPVMGQGIEGLFGYPDEVRTLPHLGKIASFGLAGAYCVVACAFLWAFVTVIFDNGEAPGDVDTVAQVAFASAVLVMAATMLVLAGSGLSGLMPAIAIHTGALMVSATCVHNERRAIELTIKVNESAAVANRMALGAAHNAMLSRISNRPSSLEGQS